MTADELEELREKVVKLKAAETYEKIMNMFPGTPIVEYLCRENAHLTRKVIAAEKLVEVLKRTGSVWKQPISVKDCISAYEEASK